MTLKVTAYKIERDSETCTKICREHAETALTDKADKTWINAKIRICVEVSHFRSCLYLGDK